ncbi:DUF6114 domain-containing protein [Actinomadura sp. NPDC047616]|uniref:DUF6114 domain-containing protein n=1 Tax=Actinomadura sp. NPDC047616 TaxID=3155914 RepID=UPI0033DFC9F4
MRVLSRTRSWTARRPFVAGCLLIAAGMEIAIVPVAGTGLVVHTGVGGHAAFLLGAFLAAMGVTLWCAPEQRLIIAVLAVTAALAAFVMANLGGFLLGSLLAITGASFGYAWTEPPPTTRPSDEEVG